MPIDYKAVYQDLNDDDLLRIACDAESLVPGAREALAFELEKRELGTQDVDAYRAQLLSKRGLDSTSEPPRPLTKLIVWILVESLAVPGLCAELILSQRATATTMYRLQDDLHLLLMFVIGLVIVGGLATVSRKLMSCAPIYFLTVVAVPLLQSVIGAAVQFRVAVAFGGCCVGFPIIGFHLARNAELMSGTAGNRRVASVLAAQLVIIAVSLSMLSKM